MKRPASAAEIDHSGGKDRFCFRDILFECLRRPCPPSSRLWLALSAFSADDRDCKDFGSCKAFEVPFGDGEVWLFVGIEFSS